MKPSKRTCISLALLAAGAALPMPLRAQVPPAATAPAGLGDVQSLLVTLRDANTSQNDRDEAARRLAGRSTPEALDALAAVLQNGGNPRGQLSAARALAEVKDPDPRFIVPLGALIGQSDLLTQAAAQALANYRDNADVRSRLIAAAVDQDRQLRIGARIAVIESLASMTDKRSARALVDLLSSREERPEIRDAAARALQAMTGITEYGRDATRWLQWWSQNQEKSDEAFSAEVSAARAGRYDRLALRAQRLGDEVQALLTEQYRAAPDARREEMLLRYLRSSAPEVRRTGAQIVQSDFNETRPITPAVKEQLRRMIADSAAPVRLKVAEAIKMLNDPAAVEPLLAQIARETDPDAKSMQALALAQSRDLRAVPSLLQMLADPSPSIAQSAAIALRDLAAPLKKSDPALASRTADALNNRLRQTDADPAALELRVALIEAMAPLAEPELRPTYVDLLRPNEPVAVRVQALRALGELREPWVADTIITSDALSDDNKDVRLAAVEALGKTATAKDAEVIYERLKPVERDPAVQAAAWNALAALFHNEFDADTLNLWAQRFMGNPERRLFVLNELKAKLTKSVDTARGQSKSEILSNLAGVEQNIGDVRMSLGQYGQAATEYEAALEFYEAQNENRAVIDVVVGQLMDAYLKSKAYEKAIAFAAKCFARNPGLQPTLGTKILTEINALRDSGDLQNALKLAQETDKMDPPLAPQYGDEVKKLQEQLRRDIAAREKDAATIDEPPSAQDDGEDFYPPQRSREPIGAMRIA